MSWLIFTVTALAVFRVADIIADEEGPFSVFRKIRRKVPARTNAGRGIRCPFCVAVTLSAVATAWLWWRGRVPADFAIIYAFGVAGAQAALRKATG